MKKYKCWNYLTGKVEFLSVRAVKRLNRLLGVHIRVLSWR